MKTTKEPISQHTVPKCYLKNFNTKIDYKKKSSEYFVDVVDKKHDNKVPYCANVKKICIENDFYTISGILEEDRRFIERLFSKTIEKEYGLVYPILIDETQLKLSSSQRLSIIHFVISQILRTPKLTNNFNSFSSNILTRGYEMLKSDRGISGIQVGKKIIDYKDKTLADVMKEYHTFNKEHINLSNFFQSIQILKTRVNDIVAVNKVHQSHYLITSDNPVYFYGNPSDINTEIKMPISHEYTLSILPKSHYPEIDNTKILRHNIDVEYSYLQSIENNLFQLDNAERFIIGKKENIQDALEVQKNFDEREFENRAKKFYKKVISLSKQKGFDINNK